MCSHQQQHMLHRMPCCVRPYNQARLAVPMPAQGVASCTRTQSHVLLRSRPQTGTMHDLHPPSTSALASTTPLGAAKRSSGTHPCRRAQTGTKRGAARKTDCLGTCVGRMEVRLQSAGVCRGRAARRPRNQRQQCNGTQQRQQQRHAAAATGGSSDSRRPMLATQPSLACHLTACCAGRAPHC